MELTKEQQEIINSDGDIKINAVAGSGKTTTVIAYAKARPAGTKILYLAFNKSVKIEAVKKFADQGLRNVQVETAHSLAYKHVVYGTSYKVKPTGYQTHEIAEMLGLQGNGEKHAEYILANHINKFITYFCNSDKLKLQELNYLDVVTDAKARTFVSSFYTYIESQSRLLLSKMDKGEIEIIHDFYLKKFQLSNPTLFFDYILFDEGQDASPAMLSIFLKQPATKVIVGDTHQQIYGWRYAVNSLEKANFKTYYLSTSFRFSQPIANLAMEVLTYKTHLGPYQPVAVIGKGTISSNTTKAVLARTNLGLLLKAIEYVTEKKKVNHIYFEGNINSYTYADDGTSLYDVLSLYNGYDGNIKNKVIQAMNNMEELEEYIEKTEDLQLGMMVEIVKEYGNRIPGIIKTIKEKHVTGNDKHKAEMIFSTVHRCKGMEYDAVHIVNDFITEEKIEKLAKDIKEGKINSSKINEEINLLYVAVTRTKNILHIPQTLLPANFPASPQINILKVKVEENAPVINMMNVPVINKNAGNLKEQTYPSPEPRQAGAAAQLPWTCQLDDELTVMYCEHIPLKQMAEHFGRTKGAIKSRIRKLELADIYG